MTNADDEAVEDILRFLQDKQEKRPPKTTNALQWLDNVILIVLKWIDRLVLVTIIFAQVLGYFFCILGGIIAVKTFIETM